MISAEYLAGFMDGEGTIGSYLSCGKLNIYVQLANTNIEILAEIRDAFGGVIYTTKPRGKNSKQVFILRFKGADRLEVLTKIAPFLRIKKHQAGLAISYLNTKIDCRKRATGISPEIQAHREDVARQLTTLNKRGL